jgi:predicted NBD/HSP70 family sugar kinase
VDTLDSRTLVAAYRAGDEFTVSVVRAAVRFLGQAIAAIHLDTGVERIILVGGFARAMGEQWRSDVVAAAAQSGWAAEQQWNHWIELGDVPDGALVGAGLAVTGAS